MLFRSPGTTIALADGATVLRQASELAGTQTETAGIIIKCVADTATTTGLQQTGLLVESL